MHTELARAAMYSRDPYFRNAIALGHWLDGSPALMDLSIFKGHGIVHGPPGMGKSVTMHSFTRQLAARQSPVYEEYCRRHGYPWQPVSIVYLNFVEGRDDREFNYLRECAGLGGMSWKFFDARPGRASHVYNPLTQKAFRHLGKGDLAAHITGAADFSQGEAYGVKYFGEKAEAQLVRLMEKRDRIRSYWDLAKLLVDDGAMKELDFSGRDRDRGDQLVDHFTILSSVHPFNERPRHAGDRPELFAAGIDMEDIFREPHFVFFNLDWVKGKRAHTVGKHILFDLERTAQIMRDERRCHVFFVADEAPSLIQSAGVIASLDTIRHREISVVLASQHRK